MTDPTFEALLQDRAEAYKRIEQLEADRNPALEWHRKQKAKDDRIEQLEQLCNDLFDHVCAEQIGARVNMQQFVELSERMGDLGLLEVDE